MRTAYKFTLAWSDGTEAYEVQQYHASWQDASAAAEAMHAVYRDELSTVTVERV